MFIVALFHTPNTDRQIYTYSQPACEKNPKQESGFLLSSKRVLNSSQRNLQKQMRSFFCFSLHIKTSELHDTHIFRTRKASYDKCYQKLSYEMMEKEIKNVILKTQDGCSCMNTYAFICCDEFSLATKTLRIKNKDEEYMFVNFKTSKIYAKEEPNRRKFLYQTL
ncbi:hypothetical protein FF38_05041 [Lucilia cuprina]|uniref:Uncharacterized protein n=1 Tax=Lucilia cuprina TaxID=7375 RepID=A0A0L0CK86_LUCCU|nr:hypothetical protein FF38_05041 [Lucilia cuprina]